MILVNELNRFEMKFVGYQFPGDNFDVYDNNWLLVSISVDHPSGSWKTTDACLLTWEAAGLAEWFRDIADGQEVESEESFMEPNLRFEIDNDNNRKLRVYFELECRPDWAPSDGAGMDDLWVEFEINSRDISAAADAIEKDLIRYPQRPAK